MLSLVGFALLVAGYWIIRSGGLWADNDSSFMATAIRTVARDARLVPDAVEVYANGYGYQVVSAVVVAFTGLDVATLQQYVYPLLSAFVAIPAWVAYRELLGNARVATLATLLLFLVPGYLFSILRGSHERVDRVLIFVILWLMVRGLRDRGSLLVTGAHAALVVLLAYALIATNDLFGISMLSATAVAVGGAWILERGPSAARSVSRQIVAELRWVTAAGFVAVAIFVLFVYEPAGHSLRQMAQVPTAIVTAIISEGTTPDGAASPPGDAVDAPTARADPWAGIATRWVHPGVYVVLSLGEYLVIGGSAVAWLHLGWRLTRGKARPTFGVLLLWLLWAGFALQMVAAVFSDRGGAIATNLQYRSFTILAAVAAPVLAHWLVLIGALRWPRPALRYGIAVLAVAALLKASNEPIVSNNWTFYTASEMSGLVWADAHQRNTFTWTGPDERLAAAYGVAAGVPQNSNAWAFGRSQPRFRSFFISDVVRLHSARFRAPIPAVGSHDLVYDNGSAQLYRTRASAALQR